MIMEDLNKAERGAISPLGHDVTGRFSRKGTKKKENELPAWRRSLLDCVLVGLFMFFLAATDFTLFAGSGNIDLFVGSIFPRLEIFLAWCVILLFGMGAALLLCSQKTLKCLLAALFSLAFVYVMFKQFAQFNKEILVMGSLMSIYWPIGLGFAGVTYYVYSQKKLVFKVLLTIASAVFFMHTYVAYTQHVYDRDFIELHNEQQASADKDRRFIHLMFPNLVSQTYLATMKKDKDMTRMREIMQGFFLKNNFRNYTQAYAPEDHYLKNMIKSFNLESDNNAVSYLLTMRPLTEYWRFYNLRSDYIFLQSNELYDLFKKYNFQVSAYKTRDIDMCHKDHQFNVDRFIEIINRPADLFAFDLPTGTRVNVLLIEWLNSMQLFGNLSKIYNIFHKAVNFDDVPMLGFSYEGLYVANSLDTFDVILHHMQEDKGRQAYFALIDLPSDMYIYDEYCQIKPRTEWRALSNQPRVRHDYTLEKQEAYLAQTRCLFGKLEQFIERMKAQNLWKNTVMVIQGVSGVNNFLNQPINDTKENFIANHLVTFAIHDDKMVKGERNTKSCSTSGLLFEYLYKKNKCKNENPIIHESLMRHTSAELDKLPTVKNDVSEKIFAKWYKSWQEVNGDTQFDVSRIHSVAEKQQSAATQNEVTVEAEVKSMSEEEDQPDETDEDELQDEEDVADDNEQETTDEPQTDEDKKIEAEIQEDVQRTVADAEAEIQKEIQELETETDATAKTAEKADNASVATDNGEDFGLDKKAVEKENVTPKVETADGAVEK
ncbi:MAG: hypothetical protein J6Y91_01755 [Alphaproteobacteria bacterium]|nr:hypothetical protein [Alphaproteobacteria bacterium]